LALSGAVIVLLGVDSVLAPGELTDLEGVRNPFGLEGAPWLVDAEIVLLLLFVACILASAVRVREQIKWIALAGSFVGLLLSTVLGLIVVAEGMRGSRGSTPLCSAVCVEGAFSEVRRKQNVLTCLPLALLCSLGKGTTRSVEA
jgi:hypothetical protein